MIYWKIGLELVAVLWLWGTALTSVIKLMFMLIMINKRRLKVQFNSTKIISWIIIWAISQSISGLLFLTPVEPIIRFIAFLFAATILNYGLFKTLKKKMGASEFEFQLIFAFLYFPVVINVIRHSVLEDVEFVEHN